MDQQQPATTSAADRIQLGIVEEMRRTVAADFDLDTEAYEIIDPIRRQIKVDGRRFRLSAHRPDRTPVLRLLDTRGLALLDRIALTRATVCRTSTQLLRTLRRVEARDTAGRPALMRRLLWDRP